MEVETLVVLAAVEMLLVGLQQVVQEHLDRATMVVLDLVGLPMQVEVEVALAQ
jgi:hypothetical protein